MALSSLGAVKGNPKLRSAQQLYPLLGAWLLGYLCCWFASSGDTCSEGGVTQTQQVHSSLETSTIPTVSRGDEMQTGMILPFERTEPTEFLPGTQTDAYTFFHRYLYLFSKDSPTHPTDFGELQKMNTWSTYPEAYHNHWQRYRGKELVFMEIGVQSGGKIAMLRDYFGPGLTYVGLDINPSTKMFDSADWVHIEVGDSADPTWLAQIRKKYPKVDIFLDDGGHTMEQQRIAIQELLPHVQPNGVYMCEDLNTSWSKRYGGKASVDYRDQAFGDTTMVGLVHRSLDWLMYHWISRGGKDSLEDFWPETWWKTFATSVKHIHYYNQIVVYEKGLVEEPFPTKTIGTEIPFTDSGTHKKVDWPAVLKKLQSYTNSKWEM